MKILWYILLVNCCLMIAVNSYQSTMHQMSYAPRIPQYEKSRFVESDPSDINSFILNTEVTDKKVAANPSDEEQEVYPTTASASSSHLKDGFLFFNWGKEYSPEDTISGHDGKWMSKEGTKYQYLILKFEIPTKIDIMQIMWLIPPTSFKIEFNIEDNGQFIALTKQEVKYRPINENGEKQTLSQVSMENTLYFKKPIHAKNIKINMWDSLKNNDQFGVDKVKFYNIKTFFTAVNQTVNPCANYCMYVNTDKPKPGTLVEAADCLSGMSLGDNREVFELSYDRSIRTYTNRLCVGYHQKTLEIMLFECKSPVQFKVLFNQDGSFSFKEIEYMCIYIDDSATNSDNYARMLNDNNIQVSSTFEPESEKYKKTNILLSSENYWMSNPGQAKATMTLNFGKLSESEWEIKKIDQINILWTLEPLDFRVYVWTPGSSWTMVYMIKDNKEKRTNIILKSLKASSILIEMDKGNVYEDKSNQVAYGINYVEIFSNSYKLKLTECKNKAIKVKFFNLESQYNIKILNTKEFNDEKSKFSTAFESMISAYNSVKAASKEVEKAKSNANEIKSRFDNVKKQIGNTSQKRDQFISENMLKQKNSQFSDYVNKLEKSDVTSTNMQKNSSLPQANMQAGISFSSFLENRLQSNAREANYALGSSASDIDEVGTSQHSPATNCLSLRQLYSEIKSGFYWIKPECSSEPMKVWCDFSIGLAAVDIHIYSGENGASDPDLTELKLYTATDIQRQCAKLGLYPIEIKDEIMVKRIVQFAKYLGLNIANPQAIPLAYDYSCGSEKGCHTGVFASLNKQGTSTVYTSNISNNPDAVMAGIGFNSEEKLTVFHPKKTKIIGIVCSTNETAVKNNSQVQLIGCEVTLSNLGQTFIPNTITLIECESSCQMANKEVYGGPIYDGNSSICKAAVHSGAIKNIGGKVKLLVLPPGTASNNSDTKNGVKSSIKPKKDEEGAGGTFGFSFEEFRPECPINQFSNKGMYSFLESETTYSSEGIQISETPGGTAGMAGQSQNKNYQLSLNSPIYGDNKIQTTINSDGKVGFAVNPNIVDGNFGSLKNVNLADVNENLYGIDHNYGAAAAAAANKFGKFNLGDITRGAVTAVKELENLSKYERAKNEANANANINLLGLTSYAGLGLNLGGDGGGAGTSKIEELGTTQASINARSEANKLDNNLKRSKAAALQSSAYGDSMASSDNITETAEVPPPYESCSPTTESGINSTNQLLKENFENKFTSSDEQCKKVQSTLNELEKNISWANGDEGISSKGLAKNLKECQGLMNKLNRDLNESKLKTNSRKDKTQKLCDKWGSRLGNLNKFNKFSSKDNGKKSIDKMFDSVSIKSGEGHNFAETKFANLKEGRTKVIAMTSSPKPKLGVVGTLQLIKGKDAYDFIVTVEVMTVSSTGNFGVAVRLKDNFTYYAVDIDMSKNKKSLIKVLNGVVTELDSSTDGAIIPNSWHLITIRTLSTNIKVEIADLESGTGKKYLASTDSSIARGGIGIYSTATEGGVYFDKLNMKALPCWTPWQSRKDIKIVSDKVNSYKEDFKGNIERSYQNIDSPNSLNGPSVFSMKMADDSAIVSCSDDENNQSGGSGGAGGSGDGSVGAGGSGGDDAGAGAGGSDGNNRSRGSGGSGGSKGGSGSNVTGNNKKTGGGSKGSGEGIRQNSMICDTTTNKQPSLLINTKLFLTDGIFRVQFIADNKNGSISIIFKYKKLSENGNDSYYTFDMNSYDNEKDNDYTLRKYSNNSFETLKIVKALPQGTPSLMKKGYIENLNFLVVVSVKDKLITISVSMSGGDLIKILEYEDVNPLKNGKVGVGTNCVTALFSEFSTSPHPIVISQSEIDNFISKNISKPFTAQTQLQNKDSNQSSKLQKTIDSSGNSNGDEIKKLIDQTNSSNQNQGGLQGGDSGQESQGGYRNSSETKVILAMQCSARATKQERDDFCLKSHKLSYDSCSVDYCSYCCMDTSTDKPSFHICQKTCTNLNIVETDLQSYDSCWNSPTLNFCSLKGQTNAEADTATCKRDFCILCCSIRPIVTKKKNNQEITSQCINVCGDKFITR